MDDNLPLNKILMLHSLAIVFTSIVQEDYKFYPQVFLDQVLYELSMLKFDRNLISTSKNSSLY